MEFAALPTMADIKAQQNEIIGYKLTKDPKPGAKVMHAVEAIDTVAYGLTARMEYHMAHPARTADLFPLVMIKYSHHDRTFEVHAPTIICHRAPQELRFTVSSEKHGHLPYHLTKINEYTQKCVIDKTKTIVSCIIEPTGNDITLSNDTAIELCFTKEAKRLGFYVTRFTRATSGVMKTGINKFYCDMDPSTVAPPASNVLKFFKMINGPSGSPMTVNFKEKSLTKLYTNLCPKCLTITKHNKCTCSKNKRKRGRSTSANKKAAKRAQAIQALEDAFK